MLPHTTLIRGRYRITEPIDGRSVGQVYRAQDEQDDRAVLLGVLPLDATRAAAMPQLAQHVIAARHDQPPTIIDHFADGARYVIVCAAPAGRPRATPPQDAAPTDHDVLTHTHALLDLLDDLHRQPVASIASAPPADAVEPPPSQWQPDPEPSAASEQPRSLSTGCLIGLVAGLVLLVAALCVALLVLLLLNAPARNPFGLGGPVVVAAAVAVSAATE